MLVEIGWPTIGIALIILAVLVETKLLVSIIKSTAKHWRGVFASLLLLAGTNTILFGVHPTVLQDYPQCNLYTVLLMFGNAIQLLFVIVMAATKS